MNSTILIAVGGLTALGAIVSMFYQPVSEYTLLALVVGVVMLAGGMFSKSRRGVDANSSSVESDT